MTARNRNAPAIDVTGEPPNSQEAEQSVLGALMLDDTAWERVSDVLSEADFYSSLHRRIVRTMRTLIESGNGIDIISVTDALRRSNEAELTGGTAYLGEIANETPSAADVRRHALIVKAHAERRRLIALAGDLARLAHTGMSPGDLARMIEQQVGQIADALNHKFDDRTFSGSRLAGILADHLQSISDGMDPGLSTGLTDLDALLGGLQPDNLVVIAGRPAMGKTTLGMNIAEHVAFDLDKRVAVFSCEMSAVELGMRTLSSRNRIDGRSLQCANLTDHQWDQTLEGLRAITESGLIVEDAPALSLAALRSRVRQLNRQAPLSLIVVDYLQLLRAPGSENRLNEVSEVSRGLKAIAKETRIPVVALSQLSRKVEERNDKRPLMSDLRESGAIEADADKIVMLYRDEYYRPESPDKGIAEANVAKNRGGPSGVARLAFRPEFTRFDNLAR